MTIYLCPQSRHSCPMFENKAAVAITAPADLKANTRQTVGKLKVAPLIWERLLLLYILSFVASIQRIFKQLDLRAKPKFMVSI